MTSERTARRAMILVLLSFILLAFAYSVVNPLHEATDELRHYRFVRHVAEHYALPVQGAVGCSAQGHHPPLFYTLAAVASGWVDTGRDICYEPPKNPFWATRYWEVGSDNKNQYLHGAAEAFPWYGEALAAHLARAVNILIGAGVVWLTWAIGRTIWPRRPYLALGGAAIVAFNPMFLFMSGAVNNDVIAAFSGAAVTLGAARLLRDDQGLRPRWGIVLGLLFGLALLSKFNLAAILVTIELAITWVAWRRRQWRQWLIVNALLALTALLLAGWWFARNQLLYGEPTGFERLTELWGARDPSESWGVALFELPYVWTSLWGRFGYGQIPMPQIIYSLLWWLSVFALLGIPIYLTRNRQELRDVGVYLLILTSNVALFFAVIFNYLLVSPAGPMGRFFFPALPSLALLIFYGLSRWIQLLRPRASAAYARLALVVSLTLATLALYALFGILAPAYATPPAYAADAVLPNATDVRFDGFLRLVGYDVSSDAVEPGQTLAVKLYWEVTSVPPGDYLLFVHLIDEAGTMVAQRDTHPGLGNFPSSQWRPGDRFVETVRVFIPETAYAPAMAELSVGYYAPVEGYRLGISAPDGTAVGDALPLGQVHISPAAANGAVPNPQDHNFGDQLRLAGYAYSKRQVHPGEPLTVTLYWQPLQDDLANYQIQLRILDQNGQIMQTLEQQPAAGTNPTSGWSTGETYVDPYTLMVDPTLPPGQYQLQLAVEDAVTEERLNLLAADGHWIDQRLLLANLRVTE